MLTPRQHNIINNWRKNWTSKGGKPLSITNATTETDAISIALDKAHAPSVVRALKTGKKPTKCARAAAKNYLKGEIATALHTSMSQANYDAWNSKVCDEIKKLYQNHSFSDYTLGNAQKLVNMTVKYIFSSDVIDPDLDFFKVAHIPIDRIIMATAKSKLGVSPLLQSWSSTNNMADLLDYQNKIRKEMVASKNEFPLIWEVENW